MDEMQWTKALSVNLRRRERKTRNNGFRGNLDVGSVTLHMDFFPSSLVYIQIYLLL